MNTQKNQIEPKKFRFSNKFKIYTISSMILFQLPLIIGTITEMNFYLKILMAILPAVPFIFALYELTKMIQSDELSAVIIKDALSLTFCITLSWTLVAGLLQLMEILPSYGFMHVYVIVVGTYLISYLITTLKYR